MINKVFELNKPLFSELFDLGFCWNNHQNVNFVTLRYIIEICTYDFLSYPYSSELKAYFKELLNERGIKGVRKFRMPEIIRWCGCEPRCTEFNKKIDYYRKLEDLVAAKVLTRRNL